MRADRMLASRYAVSFRALVAEILRVAHAHRHIMAPPSMWEGEQNVDARRAEWFPWCMCCGASGKIDLAADRIGVGVLGDIPCNRSGSHWLGCDDEMPDQAELPALIAKRDEELRAGGLDPDELFPEPGASR